MESPEQSEEGGSSCASAGAAVVTKIAPSTDSFKCLGRNHLPRPSGIDDFRKLREEDFEYVDKTFFITEFIDRRNIKVIVVPRRHRFGKSLNLSMLKWFFEKSDENVWHLFEGLHAANAGDKYRAFFQKYPVIHISFKETKADSFEDCFARARAIIKTLYGAHQVELEGKLTPPDAAQFQAIWDGSASTATYAI